MKIIKEQLNLDFKEENLQYPITDMIFFDIETTGFSPKNTCVYLIGVIHYQENQWQITQWFSETPPEEALILSEFFKFIQNYKYIIHFNGEGFDMPYITSKCTTYHMAYSFDKFISIDIFKKIRSLQKLLKLENYKQKTIERFLGIEREDVFSGGELIFVYNDYINTPNDEKLSLLLLHNREDILGMFGILPMLNYSVIPGSQYLVNALEINTTQDYGDYETKEAIFTLSLDRSLPKRVSYGFGDFYITAYNNILKLRIKIYTGELKYFYSNYKDYYYLEKEDTSIHKSIAFYVDKNYRTKAKAANCYSKKTGMFIPQYTETITPYFKIDYYDKILYFELEDKFMNDPALQQTYVKHVLERLLK